MAETPNSGPGQIGRYVIDRELGRGTMGVVYQAHDPVLGRAIALKTIFLASLLSERQRAAYEQRFLAEARIAARLQHPGIVVVHDLGRDPETGVLFIALEMLVGETLAEWIAEDRFPPWPEALRIVARAADALDHAHERGIVHRDVKPANIMILKNGEPKIMDFGIAKIDTSNLTGPGELFGTPLYMSPEQALGRPVDARSDLFSLGAIAYTLIAKHPPFRAPDVPGILSRVAHLDPDLPTEFVPGLPEDVDYVVARAMAKEPDRRYERGRDLAQDLDDVRAGRPPRNRGAWRMPERGGHTIMSGDSSPSLVTPPGQSAQGARPPGRKKGPRRVLVLALIAVAALFATLKLRPDAISFWRDVLDQATASMAPHLPSPAPSAAPTALPTPASLEAVPSPEVAPSATPQAPAVSTTAQPTPTPEPTPVPTPVATPSPAPTPAKPRATPVASPPAAPVSKHKASARASATPPVIAHLRVEFEHSLKSGTMRVWVDDRLAFFERLDSRAASRLVLDEDRKGARADALRLGPGSHAVRVEVRWGKNVRSGRTSTSFAAQATRRLVAKLSQGKLTLRWK